MKAAKDKGQTITLRRPFLISGKALELLLNAIRAGNFLETAAAFAGISQKVFCDAMRQGRVDVDGPFYDFVQEVDKALGQAEAVLVNRIVEASKTDWQAAAWKLERMFPTRWGKGRRQFEED